MKSNDKPPDSAPLKSSDSWVQHFKPNVSEQSAHGHKPDKSISGITVDMLMGVQPTYFDNETQKYPSASMQPVSNHQRCTSQKADGGESTLASLRDRKSTRLNSSHLVISYAVFCLKKKINTYINT